MPGMHPKPGTPCNDYKGYCDVFQKCREVNPSGPLATLRKILLSEESLRSVAQFLSLHWYLVLFLLLGVLVLMVSQHNLEKMWQYNILLYLHPWPCPCTAPKTTKGVDL